MNFLFHLFHRWLLSHLFGWIGRIPAIFWVFVFFFVIAAGFTWKFYDIKHNGGSAIGTIIGSSGQNGIELENPKWVRFETEDGKILSSKLTFSALYTIGDQMEVFYDKTSPINNFANSHWNAWGMLVGGLLMLALGIYVSILANRKTKAFEQAKKDHYSDAVHYDAPEEPPKDGCITIFLKVIAVIMLIVGVSSSMKYLSLSWSGEEILARVVTSKRPDLKEFSGSERKSLYARDKNGNIVFFHKIKLEDRQIGDEINLLYDPKRPGKAIVNDSLTAYGLLLTGLFMMLYAWGPGLIRRAVYHIKSKIFENSKH